MKLIHYLPLIIALAISLYSRLIGNAWDSGFLLHPDERFLGMVTQNIKIPDSFIDFFSTHKSSFNPNNVGFDFYVYGTFPIFLIKVIAHTLSLTGIVEVISMARVVSGLLDVGTLLLVYLISNRLFSNRVIAGLSALFYSILVLPTQLAHYFTVDPYLVFFITLAYLLLLKIDQKTSIILGTVFGLAIASKYSAALFLPIIIIGFLITYFKEKNLKKSVFTSMFFLLSLFLSLHLFQPYLFDGLFSFNPQIIANLKTLKSFDNPSGWFPPAVQWINQTKIIYPTLNLFWWAIGPVGSLVSVISLSIYLRKIRQNVVATLGIIWIIGLYIYAGLSFSMTGRYFYPLMPFIAIFSGYGLYLFKQKYGSTLLIIVLTFCAVPIVAFISIYNHSHPRVQATEWIQKNIQPGSVITCETWDDCLPLGGPQNYQILELEMYAPESIQKLEKLSSQLLKTNYIILSSNRVYASISSAPSLYPQTSAFYERLFKGETQFRLVASFTSRPKIPVPFVNICIIPPHLEYGKIAFPNFHCSDRGVTFIDDFAEEAYTVYDHPQVYIFKKS